MSTPDAAVRAELPNAIALALIAAGFVLGGFGGAAAAAVGVVGVSRYGPPRAAAAAFGLLCLAWGATLVGVLGIGGVVTPSLVSRGITAPAGQASAVLAIVWVVAAGVAERRRTAAVPGITPLADGGVLRRPTTTAVSLALAGAGALAVRVVASPTPMRAGMADLVANLASGTGYLRGAGSHVAVTALYVPLAPVVAAAAPGLTASVLVVVSTATVLAVARLAYLLAGVRASLAAAAVAAVIPSLWGQQLPEALCALFVTLALVFAMPARITRARAVLAGACLGAAALARPEAIVVIPVVVVWLLANLGGRVLGRVALVVMACVALLAPWQVRVHETFGTWAPTTGLGAVLAGASAPVAQHGDAIGTYQPQAPAPLGVAEGRADQADRHLAWHRSWGSHFVLVAGARVLRGWDLWSPASSARARARRGLSLPGGAPGVVIEAAAAAAAAFELLMRRRHWRLVLPLYGLPLMFTLVSAATFGDRQLRSWAAPVVATAAGLAIARLWARRPDGAT